MNSKAVSEVASTILIILLVVALAGVIYAASSGTLSQYFIKKSAYVATSAGIADSQASLLSGIPNQFPSLSPMSGDPFYIDGQQQPSPNGYKLSVQVYSPDGKTITANPVGITGPLYGKTLYVYPDPNPQSSQCSFIVSGSLPYSPRAMTTGPWSVRIVDEDNHILVFSKNVALKGTTSQAIAGGGLGFGGNTMYRADCSILPQYYNGTLTQTHNVTMDMNITHYDGNSWTTIPNDPSVSFTGNMSLSLWINPTTAGDSGDPASWHQILGKGSIAGSTENDNYQLFQMGNKLVFEWNDAVTGNHYQAITSSPTVAANNWNYISTSISGGTIKIYNNGVEQPLTFSQGLDPRSISPPNPNPPVLNLRSTTDPVTVGKQNGGPGNEFFYKGDIGAISFYNRPLTPAEIASNLKNYRA